LRPLRQLRQLRRLRFAALHRAIAPGGAQSESWSAAQPGRIGDSRANYLPPRSKQPPRGCPKGERGAATSLRPTVEVLVTNLHKSVGRSILRWGFAQIAYH
jgi:hypothetical protein